MRELLPPRRKRAAARAAQRGEVPADTGPAEVIQIMTAQLHYRLFVAGDPLTTAVADRAAAIATAAARAGLPTEAETRRSR